MIIINKVSRFRKYQGLTQKDIANKFGISVQAYSKKERGKTPFKDSEKIQLKELFSQDFPNITIDDIFFGSKVSKVENDQKKVNNYAKN